ncbi:hypothetical protein [Moheibacter sediminis]|uniref:Helix-hairpin-helix motif-containing protein n=1 Tax=Moheibacter sediminis TaxID=1434700 RepID=A0A1W1ZV26_9FLAO|nr:hypothetical protein [Moheibacter sediminis]SMC51908.1 hypothetical protein SAMN06296427_103238 [Moheibacter sediminis]
MKALSQVRYSKSQRVAVSILISSLLLIEIGIWQIDKNPKPIENLSIPNEITDLQKQIDAQEGSSNYKTSKYQSVDLQKFNPNELDKEGWMNLGFSPKQADVILKYKRSLGGNFLSKQEIKECFVINEDKFDELSPYILLPEFSSGNSNSSRYQSGNYSPRKKINYRKFNPNEYSQNDWMSIGFSEKQALTILKYKKSLGGNFTSLEQIESCFVINEDKFQEMKPHIILSVKESIPTGQKEKISIIQHPVPIKIKKFNPNEYSKEQWMELGFTEKQVGTIMNYKRSLGGKFKDAATLKKCYSISEDKFAEIEPYLIFD